MTEAREQVVKLLNSLAQAVSALTLYKRSHPAVKRSIRNAYSHMKRLQELEPRPILTFLGEEVVFGSLPLKGLGSWEWGARLAEVGVQRFECHAPVSLADFDAFVSSLYQRLTGEGDEEVVLSEESSIRFGMVALGGRRKTLAEFGAGVMGYALAEEIAALKWVDDQVRSGGKLHMAEVHTVVGSLAVAMHADSELLIPLVALKDHDQYTTTHSLNISVLTMALAEFMGLSGQDVRRLGVAGLLHDIGKTKVSAELLNKGGKLAPEELAEIRRHPSEGAKILIQREANLDLAATVAYEHHIRFDGGGYPTHKYKRACHPASDLVHVCDVYDALRTHRPYRKAWGQDRVLSYIEESLGSEFNPRLGEPFLEMMRRWGSRLHRVTSREDAVPAGMPDRPAEKEAEAASEAAATPEALIPVVEAKDPEGKPQPKKAKPTKVAATADPKAQARRKAQAQHNAQAKPKTTAEPRAKAKPKARAAADSKAQATPKAPARPQAKGPAKPRSLAKPTASGKPSTSGQLSGSPKTKTAAVKSPTSEKLASKASGLAGKPTKRREPAEIGADTVAGTGPQANAEDQQPRPAAPTQANPASKPAAASSDTPDSRTPQDAKTNAKPPKVERAQAKEQAQRAEAERSEPQPTSPSEASTPNDAVEAPQASASSAASLLPTEGVIEAPQLMELELEAQVEAFQIEAEPSDDQASAETELGAETEPDAVAEPEALAEPEAAVEPEAVEEVSAELSDAETVSDEVVAESAAEAEEVEADTRAVVEIAEVNSEEGSDAAAQLGDDESTDADASLAVDAPVGAESSNEPEATAEPEAIADAETAAEPEPADSAGDADSGSSAEVEAVADSEAPDDSESTEPDAEGEEAKAEAAAEGEDSPAPKPKRRRKTKRSRSRRRRKKKRRKPTVVASEDSPEEDSAPAEASGDGATEEQSKDPKPRSETTPVAETKPEPATVTPAEEPSAPEEDAPAAARQDEAPQPVSESAVTDGDAETEVAEDVSEPTAAAEETAPEAQILEGPESAPVDVHTEPTTRTELTNEPPMAESDKDDLDVLSDLWILEEDDLKALETEEGAEKAAPSDGDAADGDGEPERERRRARSGAAKP